jgi:ATP synthase protein I
LEKAAKIRCFPLIDNGVRNNIRGRENARGSLHQRSRRSVFLMIASQLAVGVGIALSLAIAVGQQAAYSALVGALIGVAPNYYLAGRMMRCGRDATPEESLRGIYIGEFIKIAFTAALFAMAIVLLDVEFLVVVAAYVAVMAVNWVALLVVDLGESPRSRNESEPLGLQGK